MIVTEYKIVHYFVKGLKFSICMSTQSMVILGGSFVEVSEYDRLMEEIRHEGREFYYNRAKFQG